MTNTEWFRRTTWSDADRDDFNARIERSRGAGKKAFPDSTDVAQAHAQKAESLAKLGRTEVAINEYRWTGDRSRAITRLLPRSCWP